MKAIVSRVSRSASSGFHAEENHHAARSPQLTQRFIGIAEYSVDAAFAPPVHPQRCQALGQLADVLLAQEEVVVVELNGVHSVLALQMGHDCGSTLSGLDLLTIEHRDHSTEVAPVRTSDARL